MSIEEVREAGRIRDELAATRKVLETLISWLQLELGEHNVKTLLDELHDK